MLSAFAAGPDGEIANGATGGNGGGCWSDGIGSGWNGGKGDGVGFLVGGSGIGGVGDSPGADGSAGINNITTNPKPLPKLVGQFVLGNFCICSFPADRQL